MITNFTIKNFRSLIDVSVDLGPAVVLVGKSGSGKSNFVQALRFLRDFLRGGELTESWLKNWPRDIDAGEMSFDVSFAAGDYTFRYVLSFDRKGIYTEHLVANDEHVFEGKAHGRPGNGKSSLAATHNTGDSRISIARIVLTAGIGCYEFNSSVLLHPNGNESWSTAIGLDDVARNYLGTLSNLATNLQELPKLHRISSVLARLNPSIISAELDSPQQPKRVTLTHDFSGKRVEFSLSEESDGLRRFYAYLIALYQSPPKQTLVFEEPENGIYPGALSILASEFRSAYAQRRGQVILTTHNPVLLDSFDVDEIRVVEMHNGATSISRVSREQTEAIKEKLLNPGELLTVFPAVAQMPEAVTE